MRRMILTGVILAFPFLEHCPVFLQPWLPFLGLTLLLNGFATRSAKNSFFYGWGVGTIFFGLGISWVYISIHDFGDVPGIEAGFITAVFAAFLGLFYGFQGYLLNRFLGGAFRHSFVYAVVAFPVFGIAMEVLKSGLFTGFPWLEMGITQLHGPLAGFAPLIGSYGVGGLIYLVAGLLSYGVSHRASFRILGLTFLSSCLILFSGQFLKSLSWTTSSSSPLTVSLVQGNIPQSLKWDEGNVILSLKTYAELTQALPSSDLILWPETAIPLPSNQAQEYLDSLENWLKTDHPKTTLITGIPYFEPESGQYFNAAIALGNGKGLYLKQHLVPFGEYLPLHPLFGWVFQFLNIPMSDFSEGSSDQTLIQAGPLSISTLICYESAYSKLVRQSAKNSDFIAVLSDDAWFGDSAGPYQHLQINQMRALENGRYVLSASNNGITAVINPRGEIVKKILPFARGSLTATIFPEKGETPFQRIFI